MNWTAKSEAWLLSSPSYSRAATIVNSMLVIYKCILDSVGRLFSGGYQILSLRRRNAISTCKFGKWITVVVTWTLKLCGSEKRRIIEWCLAVVQWITFWMKPSVGLCTLSSRLVSAYSLSPSSLCAVPGTRDESTPGVNSQGRTTRHLWNNILKKMWSLRLVSGRNWQATRIRRVVREYLAMMNTPPTWITPDECVGIVRNSGGGLSAATIKYNAGRLFLNDYT